MQQELGAARPNFLQRLITRLYQFVVGDPIPTPSVTDHRGHGWVSLGSAQGINDRPQNDRMQAYKDALDAWRVNPVARQIIALITDFIVTQQMTPTAPGDIGVFVDRFWTHEENRMITRMPELMDELSRAGNIYLVLFRNPIDGMSYVRPVPANQIVAIDVAENDWEKEIAFYQQVAGMSDPKKWLGLHHPDSKDSDAIMVHYAINRPVGALYGEGELATIFDSLRHYKQMLEDRVRLNRAVRALYWDVTVPSHKVEEKQAQYSVPPEPGSIVVHDNQEIWQAVAPNLHASDASHDLEAIRRHIATGAGQPPFWHGDAGDVNLATARVMQEPALRRLQRRQEHTRQMIIDLCYIALLRSQEIRAGRTKPKRESITLHLSDLTREDNRSLADAAKDIADGLAQLWMYAKSPSKTLSRRILRTIFNFAGDDLTDDEIDEILNETDFAYTPPEPFGGEGAPGEEEEEPDDATDKPDETPKGKSKNTAAVHATVSSNGYSRH